MLYSLRSCHLVVASRNLNMFAVQDLTYIKLSKAPLLMTVIAQTKGRRFCTFHLMHAAAAPPSLCCVILFSP